jgi:hypothetical protein
MPEGALDTITKLIQSPPGVLEAGRSAAGRASFGSSSSGGLLGGGDREPDCPKRIVVGQFSPVSKTGASASFPAFCAQLLLVGKDGVTELRASGFRGEPQRNRSGVGRNAGSRLEPFFVASRSNATD